MDAVEVVGFQATLLPDMELEVEGMMCQNNCGTTVRTALERVAGISRAEVSFARKRACVWGSGLTGQALVDAIQAVGFEAMVLPDVNLSVEGMMCQKNCGTTVREALQNVTGVTRAEVSFAEKRAKVWGPGVPVDALVDAVEAVGFEASLPADVELNIEGMMCQKNCGTTVKQALEAVAGASRVDVSFAEKCARVWTSRAAPATVEALVDAVQTIGFDAEVRGPSVSKSDEQTGASGILSSSTVQSNEATDREAVIASPLGWTDDSISNFGAINRRPGKEKTRARGRGLVAVSATRYNGNKTKGVRRDSQKGVKDEAGGVDLSSLSTGTFTVEGMSCAACVGKVERFVGSMAGVGGVRVALLAGQVRLLC